MTLETLGELNWPAVLLGAVIYFALGAAWYAPPLFGRAWQRSIGWDPERTPPQMNPVSYVIPLLAFVMAAIATGLVAVATGADGFADGITLGLVVGIGYAAARTVVDATFDPNLPQPVTWSLITAGYHTLGLVIVAVLVSVWH